MNQFRSTNEETAAKIIQIKQRYGRSLVILTHHYQRPEVVQIGDVRGDSLGLSRYAASSGVENIVFCGVRFMAESAAILAQPGQKIFHPDPFSGCPMSDMAELEDVERVLGELDEFFGGDACLPVTYVNSSADVKAVTGKRGGICCTSSNAELIVKRMLSTGKRLLFIPDEFLGRNTANKLGLKSDEVVLWDFSEPLGGNTEKQLKDSRLILWKGYCHVHTYFRPEHVLAARKNHPEAKIIVHPECNPDVVSMVDESGSTEFMVKYVEKAQAGSTIIIGTELNLVNRLAKENPGKNVFGLARSMCPNMFKITLHKVLSTLENLESGEQVTVSGEVKKHAALALRKMLDIV